MNNDGYAPWIEVYRCWQSSGCHERALVLEALDIPYRLVHADDTYCLLVSPRDVPKAERELATYDAENEGWPPPEEAPPHISSGVSGVVGYCLLLLIVFSFERRKAFSLDWWNAGKTYALLIREGEWWRTVTALSLHADVSHLLGNLVFGSLFGAFLCHELGTGLAWFSILLAGAGGNFINALIQPPNHMSVGASTAVFGALGILVALQWKRRSQWKQQRLRRWAPLIIGAVLLGYLGTSGERTDVLAHITGMTAGALFGVVFGTFAHRIHLTARQQSMLAWITPLVLVLSWVLAFLSA